MTTQPLWNRADELRAAQDSARHSAGQLARRARERAEALAGTRDGPGDPGPSVSGWRNVYPTYHGRYKAMLTPLGAKKPVLIGEYDTAAEAAGALKLLLIAQDAETRLAGGWR